MRSDCLPKPVEELLLRCELLKRAINHADYHDSQANEADVAFLAADLDGLITPLLGPARSISDLVEGKSCSRLATAWTVDLVKSLSEVETRQDARDRLSCEISSILKLLDNVPAVLFPVNCRREILKARLAMHRLLFDESLKEHLRGDAGGNLETRSGFLKDKLESEELWDRFMREQLKARPEESAQKRSRRLSLFERVVSRLKSASRPIRTKALRMKQTA
ncbi:MAG: hypothetical protein P1U58_01365 [Verrucomicrobiales bacterium]|nr:hypothetical protein [Verrucomicrobiales bacterium]